MKKLTLSDLIEYTALDTKIRPEAVEAATKSMWKSLRHYLSNPLESRQGIILNRFLKFSITPSKILSVLDRKLDYHEDHAISQEEIDFYIKLYNKITDDKTSKKI